MKNPPSASTIEDLEDLYEKRPAAIFRWIPAAGFSRLNKTLRTWVGFAPEHLGASGWAICSTSPGRMFYETHIAPLLRMQGFFNEVALDLVTGRATACRSSSTPRNAARPDGSGTRPA